MISENCCNFIVQKIKELQTIIAIITEDKVTEIFCMPDDFSKFFDAMMAKYTIQPNKKRKPPHLPSIKKLLNELINRRDEFVQCHRTYLQFLRRCRGNHSIMRCRRINVSRQITIYLGIDEIEFTATIKFCFMIPRLFTLSAKRFNSRSPYFLKHYHGKHKPSQYAAVNAHAKKWCKNIEFERSIAALLN